MVKATLTEVRDLGMQVNRLNSGELVDLCILKFTTDSGDDVYTYTMTKGCHASSNLGKMVRTILGRNLTKEDYIKADDGTEYFDSSVLLKQEVLIELSDNNTVIGVYGAEE